ncbi:hypothetical protein TRAPUB_10322, partial [Trametes pubescens]
PKPGRWKPPQQVSRESERTAETSESLKEHRKRAQMMQLADLQRSTGARGTQHRVEPNIEHTGATCVRQDRERAESEA